MKLKALRVLRFNSQALRQSSGPMMAKLHCRVWDSNSWHLGGNGPNFFVSWPISKCFTSNLGASRKARQWVPSHPFIIKKRMFFVHFLPPTLTPCPGIELMTLWVHKCDPRARQQSSGQKTNVRHRMCSLEGWDGVHCIAFFVAPQIMVKHFEIWPTVPKLRLIEVSKVWRLEMTINRSKIILCKS